MITNLRRIAFTAVLAALSVSACLTHQRHGRPSPIWSVDNLVPWCVVPYDSKERRPEERAQMLARLGFKHFAYDWREEHIPTFDAEIEALKTHGIELYAWLFPFDAGDPRAEATLEMFRRHGVHPQLWVILNDGYGSHEERLERATDRIEALAKLAAPYGSKVELYNHNHWGGVMENQLAILSRLKERGITDVGIVYNFSHARDAEHDDTLNFPAIWKKIQPYVVAVNITGTAMEGTHIYPSQGDRELEMMRTIQESGWHGRVGVIAERGGDAEVTLRNYIKGVDWLAKEIAASGSGGPKPFS